MAKTGDEAGEREGDKIYNNINSIDGICTNCRVLIKSRERHYDFYSYNYYWSSWKIRTGTVVDYTKRHIKVKFSWLFFFRWTKWYDTNMGSDYLIIEVLNVDKVWSKK